uniref:Alpha-L-fucosidase n=1 Tax=Opuntia streptacantha TaxID=393608 RepID=A0A7C8ZMS3_OPUST
MESPITFGLIVTLLLVLRSNLAQSRSSINDCDFPAIFNFGDSNSDTGGLSAAFRPVPPPYGETFFGAPAGRNSDGRLIIDFLAESLGLPHVSAYLDSVGTNFSHGANFATAGSTVRPPNFTISQFGVSPVSLDVQFVQFSEFLTRSQIVRKRGGVFEGLLPQEDYFSRALYTFDIGQNDLTYGYKLNMTTDQVKAYVPDVLAQFSKVVRDVYANGGRSFWIHNTGPLGCLSYTLVVLFPLSTSQLDKFGCSVPHNEAAQYYNTKLKEVVAQLRKDLPSASITYVDVYSLKHTLFTQPKKLGFKKALVACCGHGGKYNFNNTERCGSTKLVNGKEVIIAKSCKKPSVRVLWDGIHYTEAANKWIFDQILNDNSFLDPPIPLKMACQRATSN